jgi:PqqD family protein of HPr-rel-A system
MGAGAPAPDGRVVTRSAAVTLERVGEEAILHDRDGGRVHVVNRSAARLWELCDGRATLDEIVASFAAAHGARPDAVRADVEAALAQFRALGVVT